MVYRLQDTSKVENLFAGWDDTMIWSCMQKIMGDIYVTDLAEPRAAMALLGDFCFFAGEPAKELVQYKPIEHQQDFMIMVPQNDEWAALIEACYGEKAKMAMRYAIKKEGDVFDREKLKAAVAAAPPEYEIRMIDRELFEQCRNSGWCEDLVAQFADYDSFQKLGLGACAVKDGQVVSGASTYSRYQDGIEIEIDTHIEFRRQGLALACGAKLILVCLERGLYPSWDAENLGSVALAEKLGYHFDYEYSVFKIYGW